MRPVVHVLPDAGQVKSALPTVTRVYHPRITADTQVEIAGGCLLKMILGPVRNLPGVAELPIWLHGQALQMEAGTDTPSRPVTAWNDTSQ